MNEKIYRHKIITVMCEYGGAFLWQKDSGICGLSDTYVGPNIVDCWTLHVIWPDGWKISKSLEERFVKWQLNFERHSLGNPNFNWRTHFSEEDALVDELQDVLGWKEYIVRPSDWRSRLLNEYPYG